MHVDRSRKTARKLALLAIAALTVLFAPTGAARGQCQRQIVQQANPPAGNNWFGCSTAISGEFAAVGYADATNGAGSGAVRMYRLDPATNQWQFSQTLIPVDNQAGDSFGWRVRMHGDLLAAVAPGDDDQGISSGSAYVFRYNPRTEVWEQEAKLLASDGAAQSGFGFDVDIGGDIAVVGASRPTGNGREAAYVFVRNANGTWTEETVLDVRDPEALFGHAVAVAGTAVLVSLWHHGYSPGDVQEEVRVFRRDERAGFWRREATLLNPDPIPGEALLFGTTLSASANTILIASAGITEGNAKLFGYLFQYEPEVDTWLFKATLSAATPGVGVSPLTPWVDVAGDRAIVGDMFDLSAAGQNGSALVYVRNPDSDQWEHKATLRASDGVRAQNDFGFAVAVSDDHAFVGGPRFASFSPNGTVGPGRAYFFDLANPDCNANIVCDDLDIASGTSDDDNANGVPDECEGGVPGDVNGDGLVNVDDLIAVILGWGPCPAPPASCAADVAPHPDGDGQVNVDDLILVILNWSA